MVVPEDTDLSIFDGCNVRVVHPATQTILVGKLRAFDEHNVVVIHNDRSWDGYYPASIREDGYKYGYAFTRNHTDTFVIDIENLTGGDYGDVF